MLQKMKNMKKEENTGRRRRKGSYKDDYKNKYNM